MKDHKIHKLKAFHDDDLETIFEDLGIINKYRAGQLNCAFCGDIITHKNLHSLFPDSGSIKFTCAKPECVKLLISKIESNKYD